jgi:hypothetical protein
LDRTSTSPERKPNHAHVLGKLKNQRKIKFSCLYEILIIYTSYFFISWKVCLYIDYSAFLKEYHSAFVILKSHSTCLLFSFILMYKKNLMIEGKEC